MDRRKYSRTLKIAIYAALAMLVVSGLAFPLAQRSVSAPARTSPAIPPPDAVHISAAPAAGGPVEITSVVGPLGPLNPGGPGVSVTLTNTSNEPVVSLNAVLRLDRDFDFGFGVTPSKPLSPGQQTTAERVLIAAGFSDNVAYPLTISGTLRNGGSFSYTRQVFISPPSK